MVGFNHAFGRGARGTPELLRRLAEPAGVAVHVVPPLRIDGVAVSSTSIREALRDGDVRRAASLLGRPYSASGVVMRGAARGRTLGFPTANLPAAPAFLLANGVYAARATWDGESAAAVVNVGVRPTVDGATRLTEAHLLDVAPDLYGRRITLTFLDRIRRRAPVRVAGRAPRPDRRGRDDRAADPQPDALRRRGRAQGGAAPVASPGPA